MEKITVMIVEDQEIIRKSLGIVLKLHDDIDVVALAANGQEAIELADRFFPSIVLMDVQMPVMDGVRATEHIKKAHPDIKVIMLTTFQDTEVVSRALHAGAEGYILKAIDPADLAAAIRLVSRGETMISQEVAKSLFNRSMAPQSTAKDTEYGLTERELQVLKCISDGLANRAIAEKLFLSEGTVKNYISNIYSKLNVRNRTSALKKVSDERLL